MDSDYFSDMAYDIIVRAARISDTLKSELGAMSGIYQNEDDWLNGVWKHLQMIMKGPDEYVDYWNLEDEEGVTPGELKKGVTALCSRPSADEGHLADGQSFPYRTNRQAADHPEADNAAQHGDRRQGQRPGHPGVAAPGAGACSPSLLITPRLHTHIEKIWKVCFILNKPWQPIKKFNRFSRSNQWSPSNQPTNF